MTTLADTGRPPVAVRTQLIATVGIALSALLTAVATFWDINDTSPGAHAGRNYLITLGIIAAVAALAYGTFVRGAAAGRPGRRSAIVAALGLVTLVLFWCGAPVVLASAAVATALVEREQLGGFGNWSKTGLVLATLTTAAAVVLSIVG
jgi:hypothetical protein